MVVWYYVLGGVLCELENWRPLVGLDRFANLY